MKQLTIYCSRDLEHEVVTALDRSEVETYLRLGHATGNRFLGRGQVPRTISWEAVVFVVPAEAAERIERVVERLQAYAGRCEFEPCLRIVVSAVERVH